MDQNKTKNSIKVIVMAAVLGAFAGAVVWTFLKAVSLATDLLWNELPERLGKALGEAAVNPFAGVPILSDLAGGAVDSLAKVHPGVFIVPVCALGGMLMGLLHKKYGDYPDELEVVIGKIKSEKRYDYRPMAVMLSCAFVPLVFGASVGPEAGLTGIIAGLCYWIADNMKFAKHHADDLSRIGAAATLGGLFRAPLFGIFAVEEPGGEKEQGTAENEAVRADPAKADAKSAAIDLPKPAKVLLYGVATASIFGTLYAMEAWIGPATEGFPSFTRAPFGAYDLLLIVPYILAGLLIYVLFEASEKLCGKAASRLPAVVPETVCGLVIGLTALLAPVALFSGEEELLRLAELPAGIAPLSLGAAGLFKVFLTAFCIRFGMKGGHFFPLIFACALIGTAVAAAVFPDPGDHFVFAAGIVTASALGAQMKKPLAATMLLSLCFPLTFLIWAFPAAFVSSRVARLLEQRRRAHVSSGKPDREDPRSQKRQK